MSPAVIITLSVIVVAMGLFAWNRVPAPIVAVGATLVLFFTGVLTAEETLSGFGDPVVILIIALLAIAVALDQAGVGTWAGQVLLRFTRGSPRIRLIAIMLVAALFSGLIGMNGAAATMIPIVVIVALRTGVSPSKLMIPLAFACLTGSKLTLLGTPVNAIAAAQAGESGIGYIGFFDWALLGVPQLLGTIAIVVLLGDRLLPERVNSSLPADLSRHAETLVEQYRLGEGAVLLRVRETSGLVGVPWGELSLGDAAVRVVSVRRRAGGGAADDDPIVAGDRLLVRGEAQAVAEVCERLHLGILDREVTGAGDGIASELADIAEAVGTEADGRDAPHAGAAESAERVAEGAVATPSGELLGRESGLAEVLIPPRSELIGQTAFAGMSTADGKLMLLAVQRGGEDVPRLPTKLRAGDHLLLQGTWQALDEYLADPRVIAVDAPDVVKRQTVALGSGAPAAIGVLGLLVVLLAFNLVPPAVAATLCAALMVVTRVVSLPQLFRRIDWGTALLIGAMIPPAVALTKSGASAMIGDAVVELLGSSGPRVVLLGVFLATALVSQFISNTSAALVMMPIAIATGAELGVSALPLVFGVAMGASASFLTPFANGVSLMAHGPGGYRFGDFWRLGVVVLLWTCLVTVLLVPLFWPF